MRAHAHARSGALATAAQAAEMAALLEQLEALNPTPEPVVGAAPAVDGRWELVYSTVEQFRCVPLQPTPLFSMNDFVGAVGRVGQQVYITVEQFRCARRCNNTSDDFVVSPRLVVGEERGVQSRGAVVVRAPLRFQCGWGVAASHTPAPRAGPMRWRPR